jgi:hypothetical protein
MRETRDRRWRIGGRNRRRWELTVSQSLQTVRAVPVRDDRDRDRDAGRGFRVTGTLDRSLVSYDVIYDLTLSFTVSDIIYDII